MKARNLNESIIKCSGGPFAMAIPKAKINSMIECFRKVQINGSEYETQIVFVFCSTISYCFLKIDNIGEVCDDPEELECQETIFPMSTQKLIDIFENREPLKFDLDESCFKCFIESYKEWSN